MRSGTGDHSDCSDCPIRSQQYPNLRRACNRPIPMGLCALRRWCEGCRKQRRAQLSSTEFRAGHARFPNSVPPRSNRRASYRKAKFSLYFNNIWRRECQSIPIERLAHFRPPHTRNPPFELRPENGVLASDKACEDCRARAEARSSAVRPATSRSAGPPFWPRVYSHSDMRKGHVPMAAHAAFRE